MRALSEPILPIVEPDDERWGATMAQHATLPFPARVRCAACGVALVPCMTFENPIDVMCEECVS